MEPVVQPEAPSPGTTVAAQQWIQPAVTVLFLAACVAAVLQAVVRLPALESTTWPETALILTATATTLAALARELPVQNVLLAAAIVGGIGSAAAALNTATGIPFGSCFRLDDDSPLMFHGFSLAAPCVWIITVLNARSVGRLVLHPWRQSPTYGYRLIGLTVLLTFLFKLGKEPFATRVNYFWFWRPAQLAVDRCGAPLPILVGWSVTVLLSLVFATPALVKKRPAPASPDYHPLLVWFCLNALFVMALGQQTLPVTAALAIGFTVLTVVFALRGARGELSSFSARRPSRK